jgi:hypothetical protein
MGDRQSAPARDAGRVAMSFVLKGYRSRGGAIYPETFDTEEVAKQRAFELLYNEGSGITVEIWIEGSAQPLHDSARLEKEYLTHLEHEFE